MSRRLKAQSGRFAYRGSLLLLARLALAGQDGAHLFDALLPRAFELEGNPLG